MRGDLRRFLPRLKRPGRFFLSQAPGGLPSRQGVPCTQGQANPSILISQAWYTNKRPELSEPEKYLLRLFHLVLARSNYTSSITMSSLAASHETNVLTLNFASSPNARQSTVPGRMFSGLRGIWGDRHAEAAARSPHGERKKKKIAME